MLPSCKKLARTFILCALLMTASFATEIVSPNVAYYSGEISKASNDIFFARYRHPAPERLIITSDGGEVEAAIELASWVYNNKVDIAVEEYCLSSCANYVFPAGLNKMILPGAVVAWHGNYHHLFETGLWKTEVKSRMKKYGQDYATAYKYVSSQVKHLYNLERIFFKLINVDQYICWVGKMPPYNVSDFYFLSDKDMLRFGITNLSLSHDYINTDVNRFPYNIEYLELAGQSSRY